MAFNLVIILLTILSAPKPLPVILATLPKETSIAACKPPDIIAIFLARSDLTPAFFKSKYSNPVCISIDLAKPAAVPIPGAIIEPKAEGIKT